MSTVPLTRYRLSEHLAKNLLALLVLLQPTHHTLTALFGDSAAGTAAVPSQ
jgi:hypothetical protein